MKITEFKNGDAIDFLVDLIDPITRILTDEEIVNAYKAKNSKLHIAKIALKKHKEDVIEILAMMDGKKVEEYTCTPVTIVKDLIQLFNDKELMDFFSEQHEMMNTGK